MTPEEKERIKKWHKSLSSVRELELIKTDHQRCGELVSFCEGLTLLAPKVRIVQNEGDAKDLPALGIGPRLRYHAVPLGKELDAFLTALSTDPAQRSPLDPPVQEGIEKMELPAFLQLFVTQQCPFCPLTVQQLLPLPAASEHIHLAIIDGTLFPEVAEKYSVQSAPTLLLDEQFRWTGSVPLQEVAQVLSDRDPASLGAESLESMLKEGNAFQVAQMMLERDEVYSALIDLLVHEKMFVRLGAMVVMETIADQNAALAVRTVDSLWERFPHVSDQVKGDLIHVIGQAGDKSVISKLEAVTAGQFPDEVQEAARDALTAIKERV